MLKKLYLALVIVLLPFSVSARELAANDPEPITSDTIQVAPPTGPRPDVVELIAYDNVFVVPQEIPSGWTTFQFTNRGNEPHLVWIFRLPEDKSLTDYMDEVVHPWNEVWHRQRDNALHRAEIVREYGAAFPADAGPPHRRGAHHGEAMYRQMLAAMGEPMEILIDARIVDGPFVIDREIFRTASGSAPDPVVWMYEVRGGEIVRAWVVADRDRGTP